MKPMTLAIEDLPRPVGAARSITPRSRLVAALKQLPVGKCLRVEIPHLPSAVIGASIRSLAWRMKIKVTIRTVDDHVVRVWKVEEGGLRDESAPAAQEVGPADVGDRG